jgi:hypothetical protein
MANTVDLAVNVATTADVVAFDQVATSAVAMGDAVDSAATQADTASSKLDRVAGSAENLDDKAGRATGALGALSAGFEVAGLEEYASGLNNVAMVTDFASGVGQAYTLIIELESLAMVKAKIASAAHSAQTIATSAATKTAAGAQWLLNAALTANPIGLVVVALAAMTAGVVLAYNKSETFRDVVDSAFGLAKRVVGDVVDVVENVPKKIGDIVDKVQDLPEAFRSAKERVVDFVGDMVAPIQDVIDKVQDLIGRIGDIRLPKVDFNPFNGRNAPGAPADPGSYDDLYDTGGGARVVNRIEITINGAVDKYGTARELRQMLRDLDLLEGTT